MKPDNFPFINFNTLFKLKIRVKGTGYKVESYKKSKTIKMIIEF